MGAERPTQPMRRSYASGTQLVEWRRLAAEARIYASVGAWDAAHDLLWSGLQPVWRSPDLPPNAVEPIGLLLISCIHLEHRPHIREGTVWLRDLVARHPDLEPEARVLAHLLIARDELETGDYSAARRALGEIEGASSPDVGPWVLAHAEIIRARLAAREGNLPAAERTALQAASCAEKSGSDVLLGDALNFLASVLRFRRKVDAAQRLYARAATSYWRAGDAVGRVTSLINRAALLNGLGLLEESAEIFQEAHGAAVAVRRESSALRASLGMGWVAARRGEPAQARRILLQAWRQARRLGAPRDEALALEYLAESYLLAGELEKTRRAVHCCKRLIQRIAPESDIAIEIAIREALLSIAEDDLRGAIPRVRRALKRAHSADLPWEEAQAYRVLGTALARSGRKREALEAFLKARELLERIGEQLEKRLVDAWISTLQPSRSGPLARAEQPAAEGGEPFEVTGARFWIDHPLLGPDVLRRRPHPRRRASDAEAPRKPSSHAAQGRSSAKAIPAPTALQPIWNRLGLVTRTPALIKTLRLAETFAPGPSPVLILGQTGTGKELLAQGLHALSGQTGKFVPVNCAAAHKEIFLAELFGARRGAYTGATEERAGLIREAQNGTIFFDEIADLDPVAQGFLLRFLDSGEVRPLGAARSTRVRTRVAAATCRNLQQLVAQGAFRRDLYGRLIAAVLRLPPLQQRVADIEPLARAIWDRMNGSPEQFEAVFTPEVLAALRERSWPGNVRDLVHIVGQSILFVSSLGPIAAAENILENTGNLWHPERASGERTSAAATAANRPAGAAPGRRRRAGRGGRSNEELEWALEAAGGHIPEAAKLLGISRSHAYRLYRTLRGN
ncbi:MAG: AAA domain-containing protein [Candidatus Eisenbacteria bacterium]|nr:AAA domain-containing protein [Candidatus Eisenbacteria bacterium]